jgi:hypothetical protein
VKIGSRFDVQRPATSEARLTQVIAAAIARQLAQRDRSNPGVSSTPPVIVITTGR